MEPKALVKGPAAKKAGVKSDGGPKAKAFFPLFE